MFQDALANESLVAQHCYGDPNHLRHILVKLREMNRSQKHWRQYF